MSIIDYAAGFIVGIFIGSMVYIPSKITSADLNGDGIKQELIAQRETAVPFINRPIAYFLDANGNYTPRENFDFSSLTNLEAKVEAKN